MKSIPLKNAAMIYGIPVSALRALRGGHFAHVYAFERDGGEYILRLTPPNNVVDLEAQRSILAWMAYLAGHGAYVPEPLLSQNGNLVEIIPTPEGEWLAVSFTQAKGILSEVLLLEGWDDNLFQTLGCSIGRMHAIARDYVPSNEVSYPDWETGGNLFNRQIENEAWLEEKQSRLLEQIRTLPRSAEVYGLIHCDLHFGNFFVDVPGQTITLIDFDDCAYGWFSMDIAVLLFDILVLYPGMDKDEFALNFLRSFLSGYLPESPLPRFWIEQLPLFLKLLEINVYDMVAKYYPYDADEWIMKFMPGRKERLEKEIPYTVLEYSSFQSLFA